MIYLEIGFKHVLNLKGYDHALFLIVLTVPFAFKDWKKILILVTIFTIGHTLALLLSVFGIVIIKPMLIEFLIPITIFITAIFTLISAGKTSKSNNINAVELITFFFGVIHGLGFSNYFKSILSGNPSEKLIPLLEFALGVEGAQIAIVLTVLIMSYIFQNFFRCSRRDFILILSSFVIGVVLPMILESTIWK